MCADNLKDPQSIIFNSEPNGVTKYKKTPLIGGVAIFFGLIIFLIFNMSDKQQSRLEQRSETQDPKQAGAKAALNLNQKINNNWYEDSKYDDIRPKYEIKTVPTQKILDKSIATEDQVIFSKDEETLQQDFSKEEVRTKLEIFRLQQRQKIEVEKAQFEAVKSPAKIAYNNINNFNTNYQGSNDAIINTQRSFNELNPSLSTLTDQLGLNSDPNFQNSKKEFLNNNFNSENYLQSAKQPAISPYEVKAGTVIPAALIAGVNSDLPGSVTAQVRENVYDTVTGNHLLIPQGTRLVGEYDSKISFGQNRALVVWKRMIFSDGDSVNLNNMQGVDVAGYAGFNDQVDHHYLRIYGNALLLSLVGGGYELLSNQSDTESTEDTLAAAIGQQLAQVASEMIRKNINIQPTIKIRPGYKFNVLVMKDMILEKLN